MTEILNADEKIDVLREEIDAIDRQIFDLLGARFACAHEIGVAKKANGHAITDLDREKVLIDRAVAQTGFDRRFVEDFYAVIIARSKEQQ